MAALYGFINCGQFLQFVPFHFFFLDLEPNDFLEKKKKKRKKGEEEQEDDEAGVASQSSSFFFFLLYIPLPLSDSTTP